MPLHPSAAALIELIGDKGIGIRPDSTPENERAAMENIVPRGVIS